MAITKNLNLAAFGDLSVPDAYIRITSARAFKGVLPVSEPTPQTEVQMVEYGYSIYLDAQARLNGKSPLDQGMGQFVWDEAVQSNILVAGYDHLKSQDAYAGATDC
jgi:hypothetical protein